MSTGRYYVILLLLHDTQASQEQTPENFRYRLWLKTRGLSPPMCAMLTPGNATLACAMWQGVLCHRCALVWRPASWWTRRGDAAWRRSPYSEQAKTRGSSVVNHSQNRGMMWDAPKAQGVAFRSLTGCASWGSQRNGWR